MEKLNLHKARRIINKGLSKKEIPWNVPINLKNSINQNNYFNQFISLGKWENNNKKFILLTYKGELIYFEKEIVEAMWRAVNGRK